jgi:hypothetical protein
MGKSKKKKKHFMDEGSSLSMSKQIRKPMPKPSKAMSTRSETRKKKWDWRDEVDNLEYEDESSTSSE